MHYAKGLVVPGIYIIQSLLGQDLLCQPISRTSIIITLQLLGLLLKGTGGGPLGLACGGGGGAFLPAPVSGLRVLFLDSGDPP